MTLREKLMHYTNDLGDVDLKQEAIATIEHITQYMDEEIGRASCRERV